MKQKLIIGSDNAAVELKKIVIDFLQTQGYEIEDVGVESPQDLTYYPLIAQRLCESMIHSGHQEKGILLCGTGIGMSMTANKFPGIFASVCHDCYSAERARRSNDGNVLCIGARVVGPELAKRIIMEWLAWDFQGGDSLPKVKIMRDIDRQNRCIR